MGTEGTDYAHARARMAEGIERIRHPRLPSSPPPTPHGLVASLVVTALCSGASFSFLGRKRLEDVVMVYLLGIVIVSLRYGYLPSFLSAILSVLAFDFLYIPPYYTFAVTDVGHIVTFAVMFLVALVISGLMERVRDQAERARKLAEKASAAQQEVESEQLRNALLSSISHDLKTPLAVVTGAASTLLDEHVEPSARRDLTETILQEADRLNRLVQNVLDMTRLEGGALRIRRQWHLLEEVVGSALGRFEKIFADREVRTELPSTLSLVPLDSLLIQQVLVNLLENVARYTPAGSPVLVAARVNEGEVEIEVSDRGPGIPEEARLHVFDKFFRARSDGGGAGLGLTICRGIVIAHGGRISVEPREGGGARFRFTIPIEGEPPRITAEPPEPPPNLEAQAE